ncbi:hypothetical protein H2201_003572 [Coniosporium apollinis]|uniref:Cystathionine gamma-synthase n=2 Tax=Coniosporium TaxID=2810619 RepID=A0ABQ9NVG9_9PEZI|nr:hypothetical protein H2199_008083 [Cladosporium sp. JES 115]KAJ9666384.1 hypothetical protein H2201_003572 [Coniosporium apollinis]
MASDSTLPIHTNGVPPPPSSTSTYTAATLAIHADDSLNSSTDVAPALHVSTTFRYAHNPDDLVPALDEPPDSSDTNIPAPHVYSRLTAPNTSRLEAILSQLLNGKALTYTSGLAAFHALLVFLRPKVIAIGEAYHGCHGLVTLHHNLHGLKVVDLHDEAAWDAAGLGKGDLVHVETPVNPTGEAVCIRRLADLAHKRGAVLSVDATFAPPPLQDPFKEGADIVMHSGSKYLGGHSDLLCGVLALRSERVEEGWWEGMWRERLLLGAVMGSLEGWLGVRSLRTLELRVERQSGNAEKLVGWLGGLLGGGVEGEEGALVRKAVARVRHASLQKGEMGWLREQMPGGFGPVFAIYMTTPELAKRLPSKLKLFHHATSLGGVESLIEWRRMSDAGVDERLLRVSVGVESWEDLRDDLLQGFKALAGEE